MIHENNFYEHSSSMGETVFLIVASLLILLIFMTLALFAEDIEKKTYKGRYIQRVFERLVFKKTYKGRYIQRVFERLIFKKK